MNILDKKMEFRRILLVTAVLKQRLRSHFSNISGNLYLGKNVYFP